MHILYIIRTHKQTWGVDETSTKRGTRAESTPNSSSTCGSKQQSKIAVVNSSSKASTRLRHSAACSPPRLMQIAEVNSSNK